MDFGTTLVAITAIGCATGAFCTAVNRLFGGRGRAKEADLRAAEERARLLEAQVSELRRHNELLEKQVEWHGKLLETQDRVVRQLGVPATSATPADEVNGATHQGQRERMR